MTCAPLRRSPVKCVGDARMKITPSKIASELTAQPVNRPKETPLKPLAETDFAAQLEAAAAAKKNASPESPEIIGSHNALRPLTPADMIHGLKGPPPVLKPLDTGNPNHPSAAELLPLGEAQYQHISSRQPKTENDKIHETARKWVAQTFYGAMLKQMRESPFKSEIFSGGRGGQAFSTMLDQHLADHMSRSAGSKLVNAIARKLQAKAGYARQAAPPSSRVAPAGPNNMRMPHVATSLRA
jgi:Rod binding domain-containing protein